MREPPARPAPRVFENREDKTTTRARSRRDALLRRWQKPGARCRAVELDEDHASACARSVPASLPWKAAVAPPLSPSMHVSGAGSASISAGGALAFACLRASLRRCMRRSLRTTSDRLVDTRRAPASPPKSSSVRTSGQRLSAAGPLPRIACAPYCRRLGAPRSRFGSMRRRPGEQLGIGHTKRSVCPNATELAANGQICASEPAAPDPYD
jgi:hypothetical protein